MKKIIVVYIMMVLIGITFLPLVGSTEEKNENNDKIQVLSNLPDYFNWKDHVDKTGLHLQKSRIIHNIVVAVGLLQL